MDESDEKSGSDFAWSDADCRAMGIDRSYAYLAWLVLRLGDERKAFLKYKTECHGNREYLALANSIATMESAISSPEYARAMRIMSAQYLSAVALPMAIVANKTLMGDRGASAAARVQAASKLIDQAATSLQAVKDELTLARGDVDLVKLERMIAHLEQGEAPEKQVSSADDSQLSDLL